MSWIGYTCRTLNKRLTDRAHEPETIVAELKLYLLLITGHLHGLVDDAKADKSAHQAVEDLRANVEARLDQLMGSRYSYCSTCDSDTLELEVRQGTSSDGSSTSGETHPQ